MICWRARASAPRATPPPQALPGGSLVIFVADKPLLRAWGHYLYGLIWTMQRARLGTTAAFLFYCLGRYPFRASLLSSR